MILVVVLLALGAAGAYVTIDWLEQKKKIEALEKLREIKALDGILREALTFEFAQVTTTFVLEFRETYDRPPGGAGFLNDLVHAFYSTDYTFTFGYNLQDWNWCAKVVDQAKGIVQVHAPEIVWTNAQVSINPDLLGNPIDGVFYTDLEADVRRDVKERMSQKIEQRAEAYLVDPVLKTTIERALSNFLQQTMNDAHDGNPISEVVIVETCS